MIRNFVHLIFILLGAACSNPVEEEISNQSDLSIPDWTDASHGNKADPDYEMVFPKYFVNTLEITMTSEDWSSIQSNMTALYGTAFGSGARVVEHFQIQNLTT